MHYCGIIIKEKSLSVTEAREIFGTFLEEKGICDWYSVDDYRERKFNDRISVSLKDFKEIWEKEWEKDILDTLDDFESDKTQWIEVNNLCLINDGYIDEHYLDNQFFDYYNNLKDELWELRKILLSTNVKAYLLAVQRLLDKLDEEKYDVCLIDYHN